MSYKWECPGPCHRCWVTLPAGLGAVITSQQQLLALPEGSPGASHLSVCWRLGQRTGAVNERTVRPLQPLFWYSQNLSFHSSFSSPGQSGERIDKKNHIPLSFSFFFSWPLSSFYINPEKSFFTWSSCSLLFTPLVSFTPEDLSWSLTWPSSLFPVPTSCTCSTRSTLHLPGGPTFAAALTTSAE